MTNANYLIENIAPETNLIHMVFNTKIDLSPHMLGNTKEGLAINGNNVSV